MTILVPLEQRLSPARFETPRLLKQLVAAARPLAELKTIVASIPNQAILISTLGLQEAKDSSAVENIVTTHDELYRHALYPEFAGGSAAKEVAHYSEALWTGFEHVRQSGLLTNNHILEVQAVLEKNRAGFRRIPGTALRNSLGETIYTPPSPEHVPELMAGLERFINDESIFPADPLIKMALIHHQFESIHPFYDGNGRSGRIVNVLYLVKQGLLDIPALYLSRYIVQRKADYYRLLQAVRDDDAWEDWVLYILAAVEQTARDSVGSIRAIGRLLLKMKRQIRAQYRFYSQDLINNLFRYPYTKIDFVMQDLGVSRLTAARYLDRLAEGGILHKRKTGRVNYYINLPLCRILAAISGEDASRHEADGREQTTQ